MLSQVIIRSSHELLHPTDAQLQEACLLETDLPYLAFLLPFATALVTSTSTTSLQALWLDSSLLAVLAPAEQMTRPAALRSC